MKFITEKWHNGHRHPDPNAGGGLQTEFITVAPTEWTGMVTFVESGDNMIRRFSSKSARDAWLATMSNNVG